MDATLGKKLVFTLGPKLDRTNAELVSLWERFQLRREKDAAFLSFLEANDKAASVIHEAFCPHDLNDADFCSRRFLESTKTFAYSHIGLSKFLQDGSLHLGEWYEEVHRIVHNACSAHRCKHSGECGANYPADLSTKRDVTGFHSVIDGLLAAGTGEQPKSLDVPTINDDGEPIFIVRDMTDAELLWSGLNFWQRIDKHEVSLTYAKRCIMLADEATCKKIVSSPIQHADDDYLAANVRGLRPVVLCFEDATLLHKLESIGMAVTMLNELPVSLDKLRPLIKEPVTVVSPNVEALPDLPVEALDGWLGWVAREKMSQFPLAYSWLSLLTVASAMLPDSMRCEEPQTNLYSCLVGPVHSGKSQAIKRAANLLGIQRPEFVIAQSGSPEGFVKLEEIESANGEHRVYVPDELGHLLEKAKIEGSSWPFLLNTAFSEQQFKMTMARGSHTEFNCVLSILGGLVEDRFDELFTSNSTAGLYDRFIFGVCPAGHSFKFSPFDGEVVLGPDRIVVSKVHPSVWEEVHTWKDGKNDRVVELAVRAALICASFDGREVLTVDALHHAKAFVEYQMKVRSLLQPNAGRNIDAEFSIKVTNRLARVPVGEWLRQKSLLDDVHYERFGPPCAQRVLNSLASMGVIETMDKKPATGRPFKVVRLIRQENERSAPSAAN